MKHHSLYSGFLVLVLVLVSTTLRAAPWADHDTVKIDSGFVRGTTDNGITNFRSIPYAAPPVGALRWRAPQAVAPWQGVRDATHFGVACPQAGNQPQAEDCLTLNVWRSAENTGVLKPVMVWIHGGAMVSGSASIYPLQNMAKQGVVMVSMNFRLGRLGYFAHPALIAETPDEVHGNYGYLDQRAALQWVQRNITAFGGDPQRVTVFGESAGGGSVMAHLASPMSRGLFQRAILQSPAMPAARDDVIPSTRLADAEKMADAWAHSLGIHGSDAQALAALRALPLSTLLDHAGAGDVINRYSANSTVPGFAAAIIDGHFLVETPQAALAAGHIAPVPAIIGANDRDLPIGQAGNKETLFAMFGGNADTARAIYDPHGNLSLQELQQQAFADAAMVEPARHFADAMARTGNPVWLYRFAYVSDALSGYKNGALHGSEIPFVMDVPDAMVGSDKVTTADRAMAGLVSGYWVNFAKTGKPDAGKNISWPQHDPGQDRLMQFTNAGATVGADPLKARLDLWQHYRKKP